MRTSISLFNWIINLSMVLVALGLFIFNKDYERIQVAGDSMLPTYKDHEPLLVRKTQELNYDDVIVMLAPDKESILSLNPLDSIMHTDGNTYYLKRIVGKAGDVLVMSNNVLTRNGEVVPQPYLPEGVATTDFSVTVSENSIYALGDNREVSHDSRDFGSVSLENIVGYVVNPSMDMGNLGLAGVLIGTQ